MATQRPSLVMSLMFMMASGAYAQSPDAALNTLMANTLDADVSANLAVGDNSEPMTLIYIGSKNDKMLLRDITLWIDDLPPTHYEYSGPESYALQNSALHALTLSGLRHGRHSLRADFHAANADQKPGGPGKHGQLDQGFNSGNAQTVLRLDLVKGGFSNAVSLELNDLGATPASLIDARIRATDFLAADRRYFSAASTLLQLQAQNQGAAINETISNRLSASLQGLGIPEHPPVIDPPPAAAGDSHDGDGIDSIVNRYNQALALIEQGKALNGAAALDAIGRIDATDPAARSVRDQANLALGYYFLNHRQGAAAIPVFSRVRSPGPCANPALLGLGWALLMPPGLAATADNAYASEEIASRRFSTLVTPRLTADIVALKREQPPKVPTTSKDQQSALRRALVPWTELTGRDPTDPAVQEGMLVTAWSLYHFGAYEQAADNYLRVADQFDKTRGWFDAAIQHVRSGGMAAAIAAHERDTASGWHWISVDLLPARAHWWFGDTPETPREISSTFYLERLLFNDDFTDALQNYRTLRQAAGAIDGDLSRLNAVTANTPVRERLIGLRPRVLEAIESQKKRLENIAVADLELQKNQVEQYLIEARFALASIYDRPAAAGAP